MKKALKNLLALAICLSAVSVNAQDIITKKNGDEIQAKITEVGQNEIKYKRFDNLDGPVYTIGKGDVFMVKYENGTKDVFKEEQQQPAQSKVSNPNDGEGFWKSYHWTNQRVAAISPFVDLGGLGFTGPRFGMEARYRRFWVNGFYKYGNVGALNTAYLDDIEMVNPAQNIQGSGGGFTVKFLFPIRHTNGAFHIGVINEWSNYSCVFYDGDKRKDWLSTDVGSTGLGGGYSYHSKAGFYFTLGGYWGVSAFDLDYRRTWASSAIYHDYWTDFFGIAEITFGWEIGFTNN